MSGPPCATSASKPCNVCKAPGSCCSACGKVAYCGKEHQRADWATHSQICKKRADCKGALPVLTSCEKKQKCEPYVRPMLEPFCDQASRTKALFVDCFDTRSATQCMERKTELKDQLQEWLAFMKGCKANYPTSIYNTEWAVFEKEVGRLFESLDVHASCRLRQGDGSTVTNDVHIVKFSLAPAQRVACPKLNAVAQRLTSRIGQHLSTAAMNAAFARLAMESKEDGDTPMSTGEDDAQVKAHLEVFREELKVLEPHAQKMAIKVFSSPGTVSFTALFENFLAGCPERGDQWACKRLVFTHDAVPEEEKPELDSEASTLHVEPSIGIKARGCFSSLDDVCHCQDEEWAEISLKRDHGKPDPGTEYIAWGNVQGLRQALATPLSEPELLAFLLFVFHPPLKDQHWVATCVRDRMFAAQFAPTAKTATTFPHFYEVQDVCYDDNKMPIKCGGFGAGSSASASGGGGGISQCGKCTGLGSSSSLVSPKAPCTGAGAGSGSAAAKSADAPPCTCPKAAAEAAAAAAAAAAAGGAGPGSGAGSADSKSGPAPMSLGS